MSKLVLGAHRPCRAEEGPLSDDVLAAAGLLTLAGVAVLVLDDGRVTACSPLAAVLLGVPETPDDLFASHLPALLSLVREAPPVRLVLAEHAVVEAVRGLRCGRDVVVLRDVTAVVRREQGMLGLAELSRQLAVQATTAADVLLLVARTAETLTGASAAVQPLCPGPVQGPQDRRRLAVPLLCGDVPVLQLVVSRTPGGQAFDALDTELLVELAAHAAVGLGAAADRERAQADAAACQDVVDAARHDIRTPLAAGRGYAELLRTRRDRMTPEQVATALEGLRDCFERLDSFSARLLVDERLERAGVDPRWERVELAGLLESVRRDVAATTGDERAVRVASSPSAPTWLAGDREMVREVLDNLVGNALKHSPDGAPVTVTVRGDGPQVRLEVHDEGPGVPAGEQAALFDRWSRTDASRAAQVPGFGLGLSIVKRLVGAHGGQLGVTSRACEGATFWVSFPAALPVGSA